MSEANRPVRLRRRVGRGRPRSPSVRANEVEYLIVGAAPLQLLPVLQSYQSPSDDRLHA